MRRAPTLAGVTLCTILVACGEAGPVVDPESDMVDVPEAVLQASAGGQRRTFGTTTTVLYVNFDGAQITKSNTSDATTNSSFIGGGAVPPFDGDQATRDQVVALVTQLYAAYDIQVVTSRPASGDYDMALVGGTPADLGLAYSSNVTGVAPMDCDDKLPRDIAFVFSDSIKALTSASMYARRVAETAAHESGHTYGLPHSDVGCDLMSYSSCAELKTFLDQTMPMQSDSYGKCGLTSMNSHQLLLGTLGPAPTQPQPPAPPADTEAPKVAITSPAAGAKVGTSVTVKASITDDTGVTKATLLADGQALKSLASPPWELTASLAAGPHTLVVEALDAAGNKGSATVVVTVETALPTPPPGGGTEPPPSTGDTQAPRVTIGSPAEGATVATTLTLQATVVDDTAVARVDLLVDGQLSASRTGSPFDFQVSLPVGKHTLRVEALDGAGNKGSAAVTVNVDAGLPVLPGPTAPTAPGAFGARCESAADCQSGLCAEDPEVVGKYCTEICDPAANMCPDQAGCYSSTSSVSVCGRPTGAPPGASGDRLLGGCSVGPGADEGPGLLLLVVIALPLVARRRVRARRAA